MFDLEADLGSLLAIAEERHFGRAARRLGISQPALSKRLTRLEARLGGELVSRGRGGVQLSAAGAVLVEHATELVRRSRQAELACREAMSGAAGRLRIGYGIASVVRLLPEAVQRFRAVHPRVQLDLADLSSPEQLTRILDGELDLGFVREGSALPRTRSPVRLKLVPILRERLALAVRRGSLPRSTAPLSALRDEPFVMCTRTSSASYHDHVLAVCHGSGFAPRVAAEPNDLFSLLQLVRAGIGVALVPSSSAAMRIPDVIIKPLRSASAAWTIALGWRDEEARPVVAAFARIARSVAS
jgi:DNA-binding transcriptional LysR family regulator